MTNMDSALMKFLREDYPRHYSITDGREIAVRREEPHKPTFEICDKKETIIQEEGKGVSKIRWQGDQVEVIDFEGYIDQFGEEGVQRCDFVIASVAGDAFIVFNELTESESQYIRKGKSIYATRQLAASIERFYKVGNLLDGYAKKVALFSCRLTDKELNKKMKKCLMAFLKNQVMTRRGSMKEAIETIEGYGFTLDQRVYDEPYCIS